MNPAGWTSLCAGLLLVALLLWPTGPSRGGRRPIRVRTRTSLPWTATATTAAVVAASFLATSSPTLAAAGGLLGLVSARCAGAFRASRRSIRITEGVARFIGVVANQAAVSRTVQAALAAAAPMVSGEVGQAARRLAVDCQALGVPAACARFADAVRAPAAGWLADVVTVTDAGGGAWGDALWKLESEAARSAAIARLYHRKVAASFPQMIATVAMGGGLVGVMGVMSPGLRDWLLDGQGQIVVLGAAMLVALAVWWLLGQAARVPG